MFEEPHKTRFTQTKTLNAEIANRIKTHQREKEANLDQRLMKERRRFEKLEEQTLTRIL